MSVEARGIALIGYRATGKSTVGRILAERLDRPFADADREVEVLSGRSIRSIFEQDGEPAFREVESQVLATLADRLSEGGIVATGGGAILLERNRRVLRRFGFVAWLTADAETLAHRLGSIRQEVEDRPPLTSAGTLGEIAGVLESRTPLYREVADAEVSTVARDANQVASAVLESWANHQHSRVGR